MKSTRHPDLEDFAAGMGFTTRGTEDTEKGLLFWLDAFSCTVLRVRFPLCSLCLRVEFLPRPIGHLP